MPSLSMGPVHLRTTPGWELFHRYDVAVDEFQVFIRLVDHSGQKWAVDPFTFTKLPASAPLLPSVGPPPEQGVNVNGFLQAALDVAWEIGLRPQGFADPANELTAVRYHLEDMRTLAKLRTTAPGT